ncbi:UNKNOWN [Stylonychia lemnae]|uniref:Uncharacterized protein n=1 Tax=Stylonychia lemnae TaxID=5949 RepID=A0A078AR56_STYLE|nr:UNKNOWN [Stylonychia lemnae]|eukprot:CDW84890.1 UNKNOWN [Stylonychia lemnae]
MENYYFQSFKENTRFGTIKVKQGIIKYFPNTLQIEDNFMVTSNVDIQKCFLLVKKNLKVFRVKDTCAVQILNGSKKYVFAYLLYQNKLLMKKKKKNGCKCIELKVQAKPQIIQLNEIFYLFWFKNLAQIQIFNCKTMVIEQNIFLARKENWMQVQKIQKKSEFVYEIAFRNIKSLNFYEIDLLSYPFSFQLKESVQIMKDNNRLTHLSLINKNHICNILNDYNCNNHLDVQIISRSNLQLHQEVQQQLEHKILISSEDKIQLLNQKYVKMGDQPILIKLTQNKIGILTNIKEQKFDFDLFKKLNSINDIISHSKNSGICSQEYGSNYLIYIIRKLDDGRCNIWFVKIPRKVIQNIQKEMNQPRNLDALD